MSRESTRLKLRFTTNNHIVSNNMPKMLKKKGQVKAIRTGPYPDAFGKQTFKFSISEMSNQITILLIANFSMDNIQRITIITTRLGEKISNPIALRIFQSSNSVDQFCG